MLLVEFLYFDRDKSEMSDNLRYDPRHDLSVLKTTDTRKTRLTLRMINDMRKASEAREKEQEEELVLVKKMYAAPPSGGPGL
jgi:hypothetical protein